MPSRHRCRTCLGYRTVGGEPCPDCRGTGYEPERPAGTFKGPERPADKPEHDDDDPA